MSSRSWGCLPVIGLVLLCVFSSVAATLWFLQSSFAATPFVPVMLPAAEAQVLNQKLSAAGLGALQLEDRAASPALGSDPSTDPSASDALQPEPYQERAAARAISLSERELNALLESRTGRGEQLVIDLADGLASAQVLLPLDESLPLLGGKTLKLSSGLGIRMHQGRPELILKGVSVWGIPLPDAWLGGLKHQDLAQHFAGDSTAEGGFWQQLAAGIQSIEVVDGHIRIQLNE